VNKLYISASTDGWRNLAVDEFWLENLPEDDVLLHLYINANAVIIGRSQNPWAECNLQKMNQDGVQLVRRISGGGAVFHDCGNLNFSFIASEKNYDQEKQLNMILQAVQSLGIPCAFSGRNDLLADGKKFSGNAFCCRGKMRQHHGTLLIRADLSRLQNYLNVDPRKLQSKGTKSVRSRVCNLSEFVPELSSESMTASLKDAFFRTYGEFEDLSNRPLDEVLIAPYLRKQESEAWQLGETPRFDVEIENRFPWGNVQILLTLRHNMVEEARVFSDAMDADLADDVRERLMGLPYNSSRMHAALNQSEKDQIRELAGFILAEGF